MENDDQSIFNNGGQPAQQQGDQGNNDQATADQLLASIVNAEGTPKYKTVEDAIKGLAAAQEHISRLEAENSDYKGKVEKSNTLQDVVDALQKSREGQEPEKGSSSQIDEATLSAMLEQVVDKKEAQNTAKQNAALVVAQFKEAYGSEAEAKYNEAVAATGLSKSDVNALASKSPTAAMKLLGAAEKKQGMNLNSSANPAAFKDSDTGPAKFDPFQPAKNSALEKFRESRKATNKRLGITES